MIATAWKDGRTLLYVGDTAISLSQADAATLAYDLADGQSPACTGYPMPTDSDLGEYVIADVTRVANGNTIVKIVRVSDYEYNTELDLDEVYADAGSVSLTPAEVSVLVDQLRNGGTK